MLKKIVSVKIPLIQSRRRKTSVIERIFERLPRRLQLVSSLFTLIALRLKPGGIRNKQVTFIPSLHIKKLKEIIGFMAITQR